MANGDKKRVAATEKTAEDDFSGLVESLSSPKNGAAAGMRSRSAVAPGTVKPGRPLFVTPSAVIFGS